jgi:hypothetical protein
MQARKERGGGKGKEKKGGSGHTSSKVLWLVYFQKGNGESASQTSLYGPFFLRNGVGGKGTSLPQFWRTRLWGG